MDAIVRAVGRSAYDTKVTFIDHPLEFYWKNWRKFSRFYLKVCVYACAIYIFFFIYIYPRFLYFGGLFPPCITYALESVSGYEMHRTSVVILDFSLNSWGVAFLKNFIFADMKKTAARLYSAYKIRRSFIKNCFEFHIRLQVASFFIASSPFIYIFYCKFCLRSLVLALSQQVFSLIFE